MKTDPIVTHVLAALFAFITGWALKYLGPKTRLVWWQSHSFLFHIPKSPEEKVGDYSVYTNAITIQNLGHKTAENIEIVHKQKPDLFKLEPPLDYEEAETPDKEHIIRVPYLAHNHFFTIEFFSYAFTPHLAYIQTKDGYAEHAEMNPQRIVPTWLRLITGIFAYIGIAFTSYWLIRAIIFVTKITN